MSLNLLYSLILIYIFSIYLNIIPSLELRTDSTLSCFMIYSILLIPFVFITSCDKFKKYCSIYTLLFFCILLNLDTEYKQFANNYPIEKNKFNEEQENFIHENTKKGVNKCENKTEIICTNISQKSLENIQDNIFDSKNKDVFPNETLDSNVNIQGYFKDISGFSF